MSESIGPIVYSSKDNEVFIGRDMGHVKDYSEKIAAEIDQEVRSIIMKCYKKTEEILKNNAAAVEKVASFLIQNEKMSGEEFKELMQGA